MDKQSSVEPSKSRRVCLSELSVPALLSGVLGVSAILWLAIFSVL